MGDASTGDPRLSETPDSTTRQVAASDWNRAEIEAMPAPARPRERLFSRKVMIGWALFAIAAYFGVQVAKSAVRTSLRQAVESGRLKSTQTKEGLIIETRNGTRVTIRSGRDGDPSVTVDKETPTRTTTRTTVTPPTKPTAKTTPTTPPEPPPPIPPDPKKR